ncbi:MAG: tetratricopeptide repeat protein [Chitinophagales bacterium]
MNRLSQIKTFLKENPNDPFLQFALALEYIKLKDQGQSLQVFTQLAIDHPQYVGTYYHLGKLQEELKQYDEALETYQKGMKIALEEKDRHAHQELQGAFNMLRDELEDW